MKMTTGLPELDAFLEPTMASPNFRSLLLTGPPGVGKTKLAMLILRAYGGTIISAEEHPTPLARVCREMKLRLDRVRVAGVYALEGAIAALHDGVNVIDSIDTIEVVKGKRNVRGEGTAVVRAMLEARGERRLVFIAHESGESERMSATMEPKHMVDAVLSMERLTHTSHDVLIKWEKSRVADLHRNPPLRLTHKGYEFVVRAS